MVEQDGVPVGLAESRVPGQLIDFSVVATYVALYPRRPAERSAKLSGRAARRNSLSVRQALLPNVRQRTVRMRAGAHAVGFCSIIASHSRSMAFTGP